MARDSGLTKADALRALDAFLQNVAKALKKGDKVKLVDFGSFVTYRRRARPGRDPRNGQPLRIPARRVARFVAGKELKDSLG